MWKQSEIRLLLVQWDVLLFIFRFDTIRYAFKYGEIVTFEKSCLTVPVDEGGGSRICSLDVQRCSALFLIVDNRIWGRALSQYSCSCLYRLVLFFWLRGWLHLSGGGRVDSPGPSVVRLLHAKSEKY